MPLYNQDNKDFIHFMSLEETSMPLAFATTGNCEKDIEEVNEIINILTS